MSDKAMSIGADPWLRRFPADEEVALARHSLTVLVSVLVGALMLGAVWHWTSFREWIDVGALIIWLGELHGDWTAPIVVVVVYVVASLMVLPVTLVIIAIAAAFGTWYGFAYSLLGAEISALIGYFIGLLIGRDAMRRTGSRWVNRVDHYLARRGLLAIVAVRVVPLAPFTIINLVAGASRIRVRDFAVGTLMGMAPVILALSVFSGELVVTVQDPEPGRIAMLLVLLAVMGGGVWTFSRWWLKSRRRDA